MSSFGDNLRARRLARRWSQRDLAELSGVSVNNIVDYERNDSEPRMINALKLAKALDTTVEELNHVQVDKDQHS